MAKSRVLRNIVKAKSVSELQNHLAGYGGMELRFPVTVRLWRHSDGHMTIDIVRTQRKKKTGGVNR